jgi:hypothetical protein
VRLLGRTPYNVHLTCQRVAPEAELSAALTNLLQMLHNINVSASAQEICLPPLHSKHCSRRGTSK